MFLTLLLPIVAAGQELIPNGSFETYQTCPWKDNLLEEAPPWYNPNLATPDFYHRCFPTDQMELPPRTGQGLARLFMDLGWAEYLATPLKQPLEAGEAYQFELYVASPTPNRYPAGSFGAYFSGQPQKATNKGLLVLNTRPQIIDNVPQHLSQRYRWEKVGSCIVAKGGESHVTIGNFVSLPILLGYYYLFIDDVSLKPIRLNLGRDTTLCGQKATHLLDATTPGASDYLWNTGSRDATLRVSKPGKYWVTVTTPCKTLRDTITINYQLAFSLGRDTTLCDAKTMVLRVDQPGSYRWQDGSRQNSFSVRQSGRYWVQVSNDQCTAGDTVEIRYVAPPQLDLGADQHLCGAETYTIRPRFAEGKFQWLDPFTDVARSVNSAGVFRASVTNDCATLVDEVKIDFSGCPCQVYAPDAFSPNSDGQNDVFEPFACGDITFTSLAVYNRWGELIFHTDSPPYRWNGLYQGDPCPTGVYTWQANYVYQPPDQPATRQTIRNRLTLIR